MLVILGSQPSTLLNCKRRVTNQKQEVGRHGMHSIGGYKNDTDVNGSFLQWPYKGPNWFTTLYSPEPTLARRLTGYIH